MASAIHIIIYLLSAFANSSIGLHTDNHPLVQEKIKGLSFVAVPYKYESDPFPAVTAVHSNWISVIPFAFSRKGESTLHYNIKNYQWWGECPEGIDETIKMAHQHGLQVMLKPQVFIPGGWIGDLAFANENEWKKWEASYRKYILEMAEIASANDIGLFCIGTEFRKSTHLRIQFWKDLIQEVRSIYCGPLTFSANWDYYEEIPFWNEMDYIGVSTYFPLTEAKTPDINELLKKWEKYKYDFRKLNKKWNKKIIFTEFGYLSVDYCANKTWELEKKVKTLPVNELAQANALDALFQSFWNEDFWAGGFLWKWFPNGQGHEGYIERDYTPQGKIAEEIIKKWYSQ